MNRDEKEIQEYMEEAEDRVWLVRTQDSYTKMLLGFKGIDVNILDGSNININRICEKYNIDFKEPISDFNYGYWSGILAALRWVLGSEKDFLDT